MVMHYKATGPAVDPSKIEIKVPEFGKDSGMGLQLPPFGGLGPTLPSTAPDLGGSTPKTTGPSGEGGSGSNEPKVPEEHK
jgi:hypothetical protein